MGDGQQPLDGSERDAPVDDGVLADVPQKTRPEVRGGDRGLVTPEAGILALAAALAGTWALCFVMESLFGANGMFPALLGGLLIGRGAKKFARYLSERYFQ